MNENTIRLIIFIIGLGFLRRIIFTIGIFDSCSSNINYNRKDRIRILFIPFYWWYDLILRIINE